MSGGLFARALLRETGRELDGALRERLQELHARRTGGASIRSGRCPARASC